MKIRVKPSTDHLMSFVHFHSQHWERKKGQRNTEMHRSFFFIQMKKKSCGYFYFHFSLHPIKQVRFASSIESWNWSYRLQIILHTFALSILSIESGVIDSFLLSRIVGWLVICGQLKTQHWYFWKTIPLWAESNFLLFFFHVPEISVFFSFNFSFRFVHLFLLNFPKIFKFFLLLISFFIRIFSICDISIRKYLSIKSTNLCWHRIHCQFTCGLSLVKFL